MTVHKCVQQAIQLSTGEPVDLFSMHALSGHRSLLHVHVHVCSMDCDSVLNFLYSVVGPSYFVVKFSVDDTISMIPRKNIVGTTVPSVDDWCEMKWSSGEVLMATVLAAGKCDQCVCK